MSEKNLDEAVDKLEAAVDPNTVISIGGINFTPAKLMIAGGILSSVLGGLYGAFEIYKDYMDMKQQIQEYVAPDLSELNKKIELAVQNTEKTMEYTNEIKNDLKNDIRRLEAVVESVERSQKQSQREVDMEVKEIRKNVDSTVRSVTQQMNGMEKETAAELRTIRKEVDDKIKKAIDNPLANK